MVNDILYTSLAKQIYNARAVPGRHTKITGIEHVDKVIHVDQSPIGRTPRSNPATYTGVFDHVRKLFASTPEAKMRGYLQGRFSFNVKGGRCEACSGDGTIKIEMNFLPDVYVPCEVCHGARYNRETLEVHYKGKTIAEILDMPIEEAADFFAAVPAISRHMKTLCEVGLGYVRLGQPATTLSGGEAQRVKLSSELQKRSTGRTVYVLDEPTTGLHFEDIRKLLLVLGKLVDQGNTVLVIEHNLDVIKTADWILDMGPEGGSRGGLVVAEGTPEQVAANAESHTGTFLRAILDGGRARSASGNVSLRLRNQLSSRTEYSLSSLTRRVALQTATIAGVGVPLLAACGADEEPAAADDTTPDPASDTPSEAASAPARVTPARTPGEMPWPRRRMSQKAAARSWTKNRSLSCNRPRVSSRRIPQCVRTRSACSPWSRTTRSSAVAVTSRSSPLPTGPTPWARTALKPICRRSQEVAITVDGDQILLA